MFVLSMFDVTDIQRYIFQSNRLKEIIGASTLVDKALSTFLIEAIKSSVHGAYKVEWESYEHFDFLNNVDLEAELIYTGGGNALVAFRSKEVAKRVTKRLSQLLIENAPSLHFTVVHHTVEGNDFNEDRKKIMTDLQKKKYETPYKNKMGGFSITQLSDVSQLPITCIIDETPYSSESLAKMKMASEKKQPYSLDERFAIPAEFDHLGRNEGESYIGVVHIDGNEFGKRIKSVLSREMNYANAVQKIRILSKEIDRIYKSAFQKVINLLIASEKKGKIGNIKLKTADNEEREYYYLPIRDIVINGDDVTFVCDGRLALFLSYFFLKTINMEKLEGEPISACAGIAIVKAHFPFYRAYQIAEQCCQSAKKKAKSKEYDEVLSWLDFHVVSTGITGDLETTRRKHYQVAEADSNYHLLWRPWLVSDTDRYSGDAHNFQHFIQIYQEFTSGESKWPRNKLKQLELALSKGNLETSLFLSEMESRGLQLPKFLPKLTTNGFTIENQTPYYDVLEMSDFFQILEEV